MLLLFNTSAVLSDSVIVILTNVRYGNRHGITSVVVVAVVVVVT